MDRTRRELLPRIRTFGLQTLGPCERFFSLSDQQGFENLHSWPEHPQDKRRLDTQISGKVRIPKISYAAIYNHELRVEWPMAPSSRTKLDTATSSRTKGSMSALREALSNPEAFPVVQLSRDARLGKTRICKLAGILL